MAAEEAAAEHNIEAQVEQEAAEQEAYILDSLLLLALHIQAVVEEAV